MTKALNTAEADATPRAFALHRLTEADIDEAARLWLDAYPPSVTADETFETARADLRAGLAGHYGVVLDGGNLMARDAVGTALGVIQTSVDVPWEGAPRGPFVIELFVAPAARRTGLASALLAAVEAAAVSQGTTRISLNVDGDNAEAARLYTRRGYRAPKRQSS